MKTIFSDDDNEYMIEHYLTDTYGSIAAVLGFTERQIRGHLNNMGLTKSKHLYNERYFDVLDSEAKSYWLGLLFTDGYLVWRPEQRSYEVTLSLSSVDVDTVNAFAKSVGYQKDPVWRTRHISFNGYEYDSAEVFVRLHSKHMCQTLIDLGIVPAKTYRPDFPQELPYVHAFVRGVLDGDGCIYVPTNFKKSSVSFTNSNKDFLVYLRSIIYGATGVMGSIYTEKEWKHRLCYWGVEDLLVLLGWVYQHDDGWKMDRKFNKYQSLLGLAA